MAGRKKPSTPPQKTRKPRLFWANEYTDFQGYIWLGLPCETQKEAKSRIIRGPYIRTVKFVEEMD